MSEHSHNDQSQAGDGGFFSREAVSGVPWMLFGKLLLFFIYFGVSVLIVNGLGKEKYGVYSVMLNLASYFVVLCGLGLGAALTRYVPELAARKNRKGLVMFLRKSALLQLAAVCGLTLLLLCASDPLQRLFKAEHVARFDFYLKLACGLTALLLLKDFIGNVFTSVFKTRVIALLSVAHGLIWFIGLFVWLKVSPEVESALLAQMLSIGVVYLIGAALLIRYVRSLPWSTDEFGIGKRRALSFSGTVMLSTILRVMMFKYSEVFFLAAVGGTTLAGMYDLGYTLPYTAVTFIPLALLPLFTAAFAEAYIRDRACLGRLINSYYKLLMMVSMPVGVLGAFFAPRAYHIIYNGEMALAGRAASAFCLVLLLPLISMPLSAAIKAKEKVMNMVPTLVLQIVVNLFLDWLLIVRLGLGIWGGIGAVVGTFALTIPFRLWVVRDILGGVFFPFWFFARVGWALFGIAGGLWWITSRIGLFERFENQPLNILLLFVVAAIYLALFLLATRYLRLVREEDVRDFQALEIDKLNAVLRLLVR